jgi:hypothetical protein
MFREIPTRRPCSSSRRRSLPFPRHTTLHQPLKSSQPHSPTQPNLSPIRSNPTCSDQHQEELAPLAALALTCCRAYFGVRPDIQPLRSTTSPSPHSFLVRPSVYCLYPMMTEGDIWDPGCLTPQTLQPTNSQSSSQSLNLSIIVSLVRRWRKGNWGPCIPVSLTPNPSHLLSTNTSSLCTSLTFIRHLHTLNCT